MCYCFSIMTTAGSKMKNTTALFATLGTFRTLIVFNWVFGALIFALLAISFQAEEWTWRALGVGAVAGHESVVAGMRAIMVIGIVGTPIAYVVFSRLLRIVESVRTGEPFTMGNAGRLRTIAWALLGLELLHICVVAIASAASTKEMPLRINGNFDLTGWLAILLLFVLAQVFLKERACARIWRARSDGHSGQARRPAARPAYDADRARRARRHHAREPVDPEDRQGAGYPLLDA